jgi:hypothetical protein
MYADWVNSEYKQWAEALRESTVQDFWTNPMVQRMLGADFVFNLVRDIKYARRILAHNPKAICEIGGGIGQFYAVMRALGYEGDYYIYDLPAVKEFQRKYLNEITRRTGLNTDLTHTDFDFCLSFYALGEFDDETKASYIENVVKKCPHGFIIWNPHSGANEEINFDCNIEPEIPQTGEKNKILTW